MPLVLVTAGRALSELAVGRGRGAVLAVTRETLGLVEVEQLGTRGAVLLVVVAVTAVVRGRAVLLARSWGSKEIKTLLSS